MGNCFPNGVPALRIVLLRQCRLSITSALDNTLVVTKHEAGSRQWDPQKPQLGAVGLDLFHADPTGYQLGSKGTCFDSVLLLRAEVDG